MSQTYGTNSRDLKYNNRLLILKLIALNQPISRVALADRTGLSKMTIGNIVNQLISEDLVTETTAPDRIPNHCGRKPVLLQLSPRSPVFGGILLKRGFCQTVLSDLGGNILFSSDFSFQNGISEDGLLGQILDSFSALRGRTNRPIPAIGISSVGPVNSSSGTILNPPFFFGLSNIPIVRIIEEATGLPTFLIHDANAGALAEKVYGNGKDVSNFLYLHIMNGIGAGLILNDSLYSGNTGQSGEIGHTSINFSGPKCVCGNSGCLELYANLEAMQEKVEKLSAFFPDSPLANRRPTWNEIVDAGNAQDHLAVCALDEFCQYIAYALINSFNILDISCMFIGYTSSRSGTIIESLLSKHISSHVLYASYQKIEIRKSKFGGDAPLVGATAFLADKIFRSELPVLQLS